MGRLLQVCVVIITYFALAFAQCPVNYEEGPNGHCYILYGSTSGSYWASARSSCASTADSDLAIIDDLNEYEWLVNFTTANVSNSPWWIGYSDISSEGNWRWVDCTEPNAWQQSLWEPGSPGNGADDCAVVLPSGLIDDIVCDTPVNFFVCEITPKNHDARPTNLRVNTTSLLRIAVQWDVSPFNCDVFAYRVRVTDDMGQTEQKIVYGGDVDEVDITVTQVNTQYSITVNAMTVLGGDLEESAPVTVTTGPCPAKYEEGPNGHCYWFSIANNGDGYLWFWGRLDCSVEADSDLVIIDDEEELAFLQNRTSEISTVRDWWIGMSGNPDWSWVDCERPTVWQQDTLWAPGSPQEGTSGCAAMLTDSGLVADFSCDTTYLNFVCEISPSDFSDDDQNVQAVEGSPLMYGIEVRWTLAPKHCHVYGYQITYMEDTPGAVENFVWEYGDDSDSTQIMGLPPGRTFNVTVKAGTRLNENLPPVGPIQIQTEPCPENYEEGPNGHCYRFRILDNGTRWMRGRQTCDNVIDSDYAIINDQEELNFLLNRSAEVDPSMTWWIGLSDLSMPSVWRWVDCSTPDEWQEGLWAPGYPTGRGSTCAALQPSGDVVDLDCQMRLSYLCEILPKGFDSDAVTVQNLTTTPGSNSIDVSWSLPDEGCDAVGFVIYSQLSDGTGEKKSVQVKGGGSTSGVVKALSVRTSYNITVAILTSKEAELQESAAITETTGSCPTNYEEGPSGHCYKFGNVTSEGSWWQDPRSYYCAVDDDQSDLVIINDQEELDFVLNRMAELGYTNGTWWIGYSDQSVEGKWRWIDCQESTPWQEQLWAPGYPGNGARDCGALQYTGDIIDVQCDTVLGYVCEIAAREFSWDATNINNLVATGFMYGLEVTWTASQTNCDVIGHRIRYSLDEPGSEVKWMIVYGGDVESATITGLLPERTYRVSVNVLLSIDAELSPVTIYASTSQCPDSYEMGPTGHCYRFRILELGSWWPTGRRTCDNVEDSDLAIIDDADELAYLINRSAEVSPNMTWWIGLSDLSVTGDFRWVDCSTPTSYQDTLWAPGHPNYSLGSCAALQPDGTVMDMPCDSRISYLCEINPKGFDFDALLVENVTAEGGMYSVDVSWSLPMYSCDAVGYQIYYKPTGADDEDKRPVFANGGASVSGTVTGLRANTSYDITVAIYTSKDTQLQETTPVTASTLPCPDNYEEGPNGHCYQFGTVDPASWWSSGRRACDDVEDSDLAIISDAEELAFLLERSTEINENMTWWIGLSDQYNEGEWLWVDCSVPTIYQTSLWAPDYPTDAAYTCAALQPSGDMVNLNCDERLNYLCEISPKGFDLNSQTVENVAVSAGMYRVDVSWDLPPNGCNAVGYQIYYQPTSMDDIRRSVYVLGGPSVGGAVTGLRANTSYDITVAIMTSKSVELPETDAMTVTTFPCPENYEEGPNGRCYRFTVPDTGSWWPTGRRICDNEPDSDLAIINDPEELEFLLERSTEINENMTWWIGLSDLHIKGEWVWVDCSLANTYQTSLWAPDYPTDAAYMCAALQPSGDMVNLNCDERLNYLCEISPKGFDLNSQTVENVAVSAGMYRVDVSWDLPPNGCNAVGYQIYYQPTSMDDIKRSVFVDGGDSVSGSVTTLRANTSYHISVAIYTTKDTELPETEAVTMTTVPCPTNYEEGPNGRCYRFGILDTGSWWSSGRRACDNEPDSDLAIVNDPEEMAFLLERSTEINENMTWWIGYSDQSVEGDWRWVDCQTSTLYQDSLWAPSYPQNGAHDCAALRPSGDIVDLVCDETLSYLCEISPKDFSYDDTRPLDLRVTGVTYGLKVTWTPSPTSCDVIAYRVSYTIDEPDADTESVIVYGGDAQEVNIEGLPPGITYNVTVTVILSQDYELSPSPVLSSSTTPCPGGYEEGPNGRCYRYGILDTGSWWSSGRRICDNEVDSDLAVISDQVELEFLLNRTAEIAPDIMWWIGYSDQSVEGDWRWVDCQTSTPYQDSLWAPSYPQNGAHDCAALRPSGDIVDLVCDETLSYLCEISPKGFSYDDTRPLDLQVTGVTYGLKVTWTPSATSCDVIAYRVSYTIDEPDADTESVIAYGGDVQEVTIEGLLPGRTYNVTITVILSQDYELSPSPIVSASTVPCPGGYEEGPNGRCYRFRVLEYGSWWGTGRRTCDDEVDSDLAVVNDLVELDFLLQRTAAIDPGKMWWIGYSDQSVEGDWRWVDCTAATPWQEQLWAPGRPGNGLLDCAAIQPDGTMVDLVCDTALSYLCEVSPRGFSQEDANVRDVAATGTTYGLEVTWNVSTTSCNVIGYRIYYQLTEDSSTKGWVMAYGGDTSSAVIRGLKVNTAYDVTVAAFLNKDIELDPVGPVTATTDACPNGYELAPNDHCYLFVNNTAGSFWHYARETCQFGSADSDLAIINDQEELSYLMGRLGTVGDWWIGYSDISVEGSWRWIDCTQSNDWQMSLWTQGSPGNGMRDCAALLPSAGEIEAKVCDLPLPFICELSPKGFVSTDLKVQDLQVAGASYGVDVSWTVPENNCDSYGYKMYYTVGDDTEEQTEVLYGGDVAGARIQDLRPNTTIHLSVAVLIVSQDLDRVGPVMAQADPCPPNYEEAENGRCYWFSDFGQFGKNWENARFYCFEQAENFDHDLMIIDDMWELEYITNRTREFGDGRDWSLGYSDVSEEGAWKWVTCASSTPWQEGLWAPGYPGNGANDCGVFDPDTMTVRDQVCDAWDVNFICEVTPKNFAVGDDNVRDLTATAIAWDTIRVTWNVSEYNCDVVAYNIYFLDTYLGGDPTREFVYGGAVNSYDIHMVQPMTRYSISVSAERIDERLPAVDPVYVTTPEGPCPPYYEIGPSGGCYRFVSAEYGFYWTSARGGCDSVTDSDLVIIDNQMELDFIVNRTKEFDTDKDWWIGFSDFSVESDWRWVTCDPPTPWQGGLWEDGYPRNGQHDCGALSSTSRHLVDAVCDQPINYICEITPKGFTNEDMNVRLVQASPLSSTDVAVSWTLSNVTCNVYGYKVYYGVADEPFDVTSFKVAYGGNVSSLMIPSLSPSTTYTFYVAALIPDRLELPRIGPVNATTFTGPCARQNVDEDGMIMNADYPNGYAGGQVCEWLLSAPVDQFVLLQIIDFDTRVGADVVTIGSGSEFDPDQALYVLSGSKDNGQQTPAIPDKVLSEGRHLWVTFRTSEATMAHRGFQMSVTMVTQGPGVPDRKYEEVTEEGILSSTGWPDQYPNFLDITWTLTGPKNGRVRINSLEGSLESNYDFLTIGYGSPDSSIIGIYTGVLQLDGDVLESPTYTFWIRLTADESVSDKGFSLYWESFDSQEDCGTTELNEASGVITSPSYPSPYPDNQVCTWLIQLPDETTLVKVEFTAFTLEDGHDFLAIGSGKVVNEEVIAILTGDSLPPAIESSMYRMWLQFRSDESFSATGFSLDFSAIDNPNPPTPYSPEKDSVIFIIKNENPGWFTDIEQENLAMAIADSMTIYCSDKSETCEVSRALFQHRTPRDVGVLQLEFSSTDVDFLDNFAEGEDLHVITWVRDPQSEGADISTGVDPSILQMGLVDEGSQASFDKYFGDGFQYGVEPNEGPVVTEPSTTEEPSSPGLEPWAIALIVVASFSVVIMISVGLEIRHRKKMNKKISEITQSGPQSFPIDNLYEGPGTADDNPNYAVPTKKSADSSVYRNGGFHEEEEDDENTRL